MSKKKNSEKLESKSSEDLNDLENNELLDIFLEEDEPESIRTMIYGLVRDPIFLIVDLIRVFVMQKPKTVKDIIEYDIRVYCIGFSAVLITFTLTFYPHVRFLINWIVFVNLILATWRFRMYY